MATMPWDFSEPPAPGEGVPNQPTPEGAELGHELARLTLGCIERQREQFPHAPGPCGECAYIAGTLPNQTLSTVADALKAAVEGTPFYCHKGLVDGEPTRLCLGWLATQTTEESNDV